MMNGKNPDVGAIIDHIPRGSVGIEIGVWRGCSSQRFLGRTSHLHLVDPWSSSAFRESDEHGGFDAYLSRYAKKVGSNDAASFDRYYDDIYASVVKMFADKPVTIHRCTSAEFFSKFDGDAGWAYIDGSHSFDGCFADLCAAGELVSFAIFGDDYGAKDGVTSAVDAYIKKTGLNLERFGKSQYMVRIPTDVA